MEMGGYPKMPILLSKEQLREMEDDDKLFKEQLREKESNLMLLALNKLLKQSLEICNGLMKDPKEINVPLNSGPSFQPGGDHIIKFSTTEELEISDTTIIENKDDGGDGNDNSSSIEGGESVTVEIDSVYWTRLHGLVLKISGGGVVKLLWLSDVESRQSFTYRVIAVMDGVAFVTSFVGNIVGDKYPNLSKVLGLVGAPAGIFMVVASLTEYAYPEHTILIPAVASLPPLLALADRAFCFNKSLPPFLARMKRAFGFDASPTSPARVAV